MSHISSLRSQPQGGEARGWGEEVMFLFIPENRVPRWKSFANAH